MATLVRSRARSIRASVPFVLLALDFGCSASDSPATTAGGAHSGGATSTAGTAAGGALVGAGNGGSGGSSTGGAPSSGGATGVAGGGSASGGTSSSGGATSAGGAGQSGASGGADAAGGSTRGGASASAGGAATGGANGKAMGGAGGLGRGGANALGGSPGAGGSAGMNASGGAAGGGATSCPGATYNAASPPTTLTLTGNLGAHDPAVYVQGNTLYLAATGLIAKTSANLMSWNAAASPLPLPSWARSATGASGLWAPDISYFGGTYHLYYAASTFGSNKSCIGQATRAALDSGSWADQGQVICSNMGTSDRWNAIDPNVVLDDAGTPWLSLGSFWDGIKLVKLDSSGKRADTMMYSLAHHAGGEEGPWIFKRCDYFYLFMSIGACCSGAYDYKMVVGRSKVVTGPYVDKDGKDMMSGGGTLLVQGNASWVAPGHNAVIAYAGKTYNVYHALKGSSSGAATLRISEIVWDMDGWPISGGP